MSGILYAPELIAPSPIIWLPNDSGGVARSEAYDLQRYHGLQVTLDVISERDAAHDVRSASRSSRR
jgi:calcium permeable stress-gated cation channel